MTEITQIKNPGVSAVLSFFYSGLGQVYNGEIGKGMVLILFQCLNLFIITTSLALSFLLVPLLATALGGFLFVVVWIYGIYDAYKVAEKINIQS